LIGLTRMKEAHSGENIAEAIIPVLKIYNLAPYLGYFIADNASNNDTAIHGILQALRPDIKDPNSRRVRCIAHIINLVVKAFLFGDDVDSFETDFEAENLLKAQIDELLIIRKDWYTNGPYSKLRNTVNYIRETPQRRDEYFSIVKSDIEDEFKGIRYLNSCQACGLGTNIGVYN
jgi:hypothetical protein